MSNVTNYINMSYASITFLHYFQEHKQSGLPPPLPLKSLGRNNSSPFHALKVIVKSNVRYWHTKHTLLAHETCLCISNGIANNIFKRE